MTHLVVVIDERGSDGHTRIARQRAGALLIGEGVPGSLAAIGLFSREGRPGGDWGRGGSWEYGNGSGKEVEVGEAVSCMEPSDVCWWRVV